MAKTFHQMVRELEVTIHAKFGQIDVVLIYYTYFLLGYFGSVKGSPEKCYSLRYDYIVPDYRYVSHEFIVIYNIHI